MMNHDVMFSSKTDLWETPQWIFDGLNERYHFTLDACAVEENAKCTNFYSPEQDGLRQPWKGRVWCNPPYGRNIGKWVQKAADSDALVVMLLPARTDTRWFHDYIYGKAEVKFIKGRLKFGGSENPAPFPSMVVVFHGGIGARKMGYNDAMRIVSKGSVMMMCGYEISKDALLEFAEALRVVLLNVEQEMTEC